MHEKEITVEKVRTLHEFLQGKVPEGFHIKVPPKLSSKVAWTVIWFLQEETLCISDEYEMCNFCGEIYDSSSEGIYLDPESLETESGRPLPKRLHNKFGCGNCLEFRIHGEFRDKQ